MRLTNKVIQESRPGSNFREGGDGARGRGGEGEKKIKTKGKNENLTFKIGIKRETKIQRNSRIKT